MDRTSVIKNFSMYGIYEYYSCGGPGTLPGAKTGFLHRCMYLRHQEKDEIEEIVQKHSRFVILIQQNEYAMFLFQIEIQPLLHAANKPYVIITCMDDPTFPETVVGSFFNTVIENGSPKPEFKLFRKWFTTNCSVRDIDGLAPATALAKISPIPYGVDYWTLGIRKTWANTPMAAACTQDRELLRLQNSMVHFSKRISEKDVNHPKIYINFQFNLNGNGCFERLLAFNSISKDVMNIERRRVNRYETWGAYTQNVFVASPRGNGLDTIRTWEALMLGCIVIVRRLPDAPVIEELYADLPVVIIDKWSDITRDFLSQILSEYSKRTFNYEKLTMQYWINRIESAFDE
jgi:hypothetical protein